MSRIVSALPGRIRIRDPLLRHPASLERIAGQLAELPGIADIAANARAASLILHFDPAQLDIETLENKIDQIVDDTLAHLRRETLRKPTQRTRRLINRGMLLSLLASLLLLALRNKKGHAVAGYVFLAFLAGHLNQHQRTVLR